jgi:hypothetical protein
MILSSASFEHEAETLQVCLLCVKDHYVNLDYDVMPSPDLPASGSPDHKRDAG